MNQTQRRRFLIEALLQENPQYGQLTIPPQEEEQKEAVAQPVQSAAAASG